MTFTRANERWKATALGHPSIRKRREKLSTWVPECQVIEETDLKTLEGLGFAWIEADKSPNETKDDSILVGFYVHPISSMPFAAIVVKDAASIIGKKYLYYCEEGQSVKERLVIRGSICGTGAIA